MLQEQEDGLASQTPAEQFRSKIPIAIDAPVIEINTLIALRVLFEPTARIASR